MKIYGLPRTFTNLAAWLIDKGFKDVRAWHHGPKWKKNGDFGDKHGAPVEVDGMDYYLLCVKHPYTWIESCLRYKQPKNKFFRKIFRMIKPRGLARLYNKRGKEFLEFKKGLIVRHEDLFDDLGGVMRRISDEWGLERTDLSELPKDCMGRGGDVFRHKIKDKPFRRREHQEWSVGVDKDIAGKLGYDI